MIKSILALWSLMFVAACFESHGGTNEVVRNSDCYNCHVPEYLATGGPAFVGRDAELALATRCRCRCSSSA